MTFVRLNADEIANLNDLSNVGFSFDWTKKSSERSQTVAISFNGDISGLVEFERRPESLLLENY